MENTKKLEKRFYFFVPYNLSPIQQAIQAGHAALEYAHKYKDDEDYIDFIENWKTWIILNGGTTNDNRDFAGVSQGSLNQIADQLSLGDGISGGIKMAYFREPDLQNALTAVCFIADERVFNYEDYPNFPQWILQQEIVDEDEKMNSFISVEHTKKEDLLKLFPGMYPQWVREMGGEENIFLRELLKDKKLA
jgi:hypothetical protein